MLGIRLNKKAQVGETLTWIVATILIIILLILFIYASISLAKLKKIDLSDFQSEKSFSNKNGEWVDLKNSIAFSLNNKNQKAIKEWIRGKNEN